MAVGAFLLLAGSAAAQGCPTNSLSVLGLTFVSSAPSNYISHTGECTIDYPAVFYPSGSASYNLAIGTLSLSAYSDGTCGSRSRVSTHDIFTLTGPAPAVPVTFTVRLSVSITGGFAFGSAMLREGDSNTQSWTGLAPTTLEITINGYPGLPLELYMDFGMEVASRGGGNAQAWLGFPDLPAGYSLRSCQGFVAGSVVPVRTPTWGALKAIYR